MQLLDLPGVGEKTASVLTRHDINSVSDLIRYYPRTYRLFRTTTTGKITQNGLPAEATGSRNGRIGSLREADVASGWVSLVGTLTRPISRHSGHVTTQLSTFRDSSGTLIIRWFNSPFVVRAVSPTATYLLRGQITVFAGRPQIVNPELHPVAVDFLPQDELVPIYTPLGTLKSGHLRRLIQSALTHAPLPADPLPLEIQNRYHLTDLATALRDIHFPPSRSLLEVAIHRLGFDELYALQKAALKNRELTQVKTEPLHCDPALLPDWLKSLPFTPTSAQLRAIQEICADLEHPLAMHRLLAGEVGSGKTLVAAAAALAVKSAGRRTLLMAPTQILAEQLAASFRSLLPADATVSLITGSAKGDVTADIIVGTQALLSELTKFSDVGLVIIDEQHRFGVDQRLLLTHLTPPPHFLMMTATPIPRTLAMTLLSNLTLSRLDELPSHRLPVKTYYVEEAKRAAAYAWLRHEVEQRQQQAFVVVPVIDQAANQEESGTKSLQQLEADLKIRFPGVSIDILHGRLKAADKTAHLQAFRDGSTQILVATSMVEVGLDIPQANLMVIESADLFGLATLHQLRGRVGRGGQQGHCLIFATHSSPQVTERLAYFVREHDGAKLAEYDLHNRGPGELFGTVQHGFFSLRFASLSDEELLRQTHEAAKIPLI